MINKENINKNLNDEEVEEIIKTNLKKSLIKKDVYKSEELLDENNIFLTKFLHKGLSEVWEGIYYNKIIDHHIALKIVNKYIIVDYKT